MNIEKISKKPLSRGRGGARENSGRKKGSLNKATADIKAIAQGYGSDAINTLALLMRTADADSAKIAAAKELLDRGFGRPTQTTEVSGPDGGPIEHVVTPLLPQEAYLKAIGKD